MQKSGEDWGEWQHKVQAGRQTDTGKRRTERPAPAPHAKTSAAAAAPSTAATLTATRPAALSSVVTAAVKPDEGAADGVENVMDERCGPDEDADEDDEEGASVDDEASSVVEVEVAVVAGSLLSSAEVDAADALADEASAAAELAAADDTRDDPDAAALLAEPDEPTSEPVPHAMPLVDSVGLVCAHKNPLSVFLSLWGATRGKGAHGRAVGRRNGEARRPCRRRTLLAELVEVDGRVGRDVGARVVDRLGALGAVEAASDRLHRNLRVTSMVRGTSESS